MKSVKPVGVVEVRKDVAEEERLDEVCAPVDAGILAGLLFAGGGLHQAPWVGCPAGDNPLLHVMGFK